MIWNAEQASQTAPHLVETMTRLATDRSLQRTLVIACIGLAVFVLPLLGTQHCQVMHDDHSHSAPPQVEACCVFLCFTVLVGLVVMPMRGLTLARAALHLQPVRLTDHLSRWVPPPRAISFRA
jgi:hypothetical protein